MKPLHIDDDFEAIEQDLKNLLGEVHPDRLAWSAEEFLRLRKNSGLSQSALERITGVKQPKISTVETGRVRKTKKSSDQRDTPAPKMNIETLYVLARAVGAELGDFAVLPISTDAELSAEQIKELQPQLLEVEKITTLIQPRMKTYLRDIYYRTILRDNSTSQLKADQSVAFQAESLADLRHSASVILGTAGQGKSVFLRYLTIQEAIKAELLPLFFELRHLSTEPIQELILKKLMNWNLCNNSEELSSVLAKNRIALLFDAFDELSFQRRKSFLSELAELHEAYPQLSIVVSARPDSGILSCHWLNPYSIAQLRPTDVESLIRIYAQDDEADLIVARVKKADFEVIDLLRSPIFVVLLIIRFKHSQQIPSDIIAFYADLFDALVRRQNTDDGGLKREISSNLQPRQLEKAFKSICYFLHKRSGDQPAHLRAVEDIAEIYADRQSLSQDAPAKIVEDIITITNLMLEEAGMCYFIHKTVKEFYAAAHIAENAMDDQAEDFYTSMRKNWREWTGILMFLEHVDRFRFLKFFAIPGLKCFAPYRAIDIARSFRQVGISKNDSGEYAYSVEFCNTECHAFNQPSILSYGIMCQEIDIQTIFGNDEAQLICEHLEHATEIIIYREEFRKKYSGLEWDYSPVISEIGNHLSGDGFEDQIKAWEEEVQANRSPDADFEIG